MDSRWDSIPRDVAVGPIVVKQGRFHIRSRQDPSSAQIIRVGRVHPKKIERKRDCYTIYNKFDRNSDKSATAAPLLVNYAGWERKRGLRNLPRSDLRQVP